MIICLYQICFVWRVKNIKISVKSRYALSSLVYMGQNISNKDSITLLSLSEKLGISKIYLEQTFTLLRRSGIVSATKGAGGGYRLTRAPSRISVFDILFAIETSLFEKAESTVAGRDAHIECAMNEAVFGVLDDSLKTVLSGISLEDVIDRANQYRDSESYIYYL